MPSIKQRARKSFSPKWSAIRRWSCTTWVAQVGTHLSQPGSPLQCLSPPICCRPYQSGVYGERAPAQSTPGNHRRTGRLSHQLHNAALDMRTAGLFGRQVAWAVAAEDGEVCGCLEKHFGQVGAVGGDLTAPPCMKTDTLKTAALSISLEKPRDLYGQGWPRCLGAELLCCYWHSLAGKLQWRQWESWRDKNMMMCTSLTKFLRESLRIYSWGLVRTLKKLVCLLSNGKGRKPLVLKLPIEYQATNIVKAELTRQADHTVVFEPAEKLEVSWPI